MKTTGEAILRAALAEIVGDVSDQENDEDLEAAAQLAPFFCDTLDQTRLAGGARGYDVELPEGRGNFTWGNGGDIDHPVPAGVPPTGGVTQWSYVADDDEFERGEPGSITDYQQFHRKGDPGWPPVLLWADTSGVGSSVRFTVLPTPDRPVTLRLYARIPALRTITREANYDLPPGVGGYLILAFAEFLGPQMAMPVPASLYARLRAADTALLRQNPPPRVTPRLDYATRRIGYNRGYQQGF